MIIVIRCANYVSLDNKLILCGTSNKFHGFDIDFNTLICWHHL